MQGAAAVPRAVAAPQQKLQHPPEKKQVTLVEPPIMPAPWDAPLERVQSLPTAAATPTAATVANATAVAEPAAAVEPFMLELTNIRYIAGDEPYCGCGGQSTQGDT